MPSSRPPYHRDRVTIHLPEPSVVILNHLSRRRGRA
jgi:hypothetical protein